MSEPVWSCRNPWAPYVGTILKLSDSPSCRIPTYVGTILELSDSPSCRIPPYVGTILELSDSPSCRIPPYVGTILELSDSPICRNQFRAVGFPVCVNQLAVGFPICRNQFGAVRFQKLKKHMNFKMSGCRKLEFTKM